MTASVAVRLGTGLGRILPVRLRREPSGTGQRAQQLGWPHPGECPEVAVEVRLIVVAALERQVSEARMVSTTQPIHRAAEAHHPRKRLRREADVLAELADEMFLAPACFLDERT